MNTQIFLGVAKQIRAQVSEIKNIDIYNRQYDLPKESLPFNIPTVFIEFANTQWEDQLNGVQTGDSVMRVHIVMENYGDTQDVDTLDDVTATARLAHYSITYKVHAAIQGFSPESSSAMRRIKTVTDHNFDQLLIERIEYAYTEVDSSGFVFNAYEDRTITDIQVEAQIAP